MEVNQIYQGDCLDVLAGFPDGSVNCCITSPPYYGLRDYGHEGQIGLEQTPEEYVSKLVEVFREVKRVLRKDGTLWLNLGDSYGSKGGDIFTGFNERYDGTGIGGMKQAEIGKSAIAAGKVKRKTGLKPKDLIGIPWLVAFALRADGWYLRQDIIWHKPNPMPESVTDRCTKSHEYIFLLSKSAKYYYDAEAIQEESVYQENRPAGVVRNRLYDYDSKENNNPEAYRKSTKRGEFNGKTNQLKGREAFKRFLDFRNKRSVWTVTTQPYSEAHFATFPQDLIVDCIKAGCPEGGTVLDPFMGAGTTALVARKLNRNYVGIELNQDYINLANKRLKDELGMFL